MLRLQEYMEFWNMVTGKDVKSSVNDDRKYIDIDLFSDDRDINIRCQRVKIVKTRAEHKCCSPLGGDHMIPKGETCRYEEALIDNDNWRRYWTCFECIDDYRAPLWDEDEESIEDSNQEDLQNKITFSDYEDIVMLLAVYPDKGNNFVYPALGLTGEAGEVADKIKKVLRDKQGKLSESDRVSILKELGDVLWYLAAMASELKSSLKEVAGMNVSKLLDRNKRNVLHGEGDNR